MQMMQAANDVQLVTIKEAAALLRVCERTVYRLANEGTLPPVRIGRAVRYRLRDLRRIIDETTTGPPGVPAGP